MDKFSKNQGLFIIPLFIYIDIYFQSDHVGLSSWLQSIRTSTKKWGGSKSHWGTNIQLGKLPKYFLFLGILMSSSSLSALQGGEHSLCQGQLGKTLIYNKN